jgi:Uma2 family endonuclease
MLDMIFSEAKETAGDMPSLNHSYICTQIIRQLLQQPDFFPLTELTLNIDNGLTPDISVYSSEKINPDFFNDISKYDELPVMALEVVSSTQNIQTVLQKAKRLAESGVRYVLTLEPYTRTVFITRKDKENELVHNQPVEFEGISVDFKKIFEKRT